MYDQEGRPIYHVQSEWLALGARIHLMDLMDQEMFFIQRKVFSFLAQYTVYAGDTECARIQQEFSFFHPRLSVESAYGDFELDGDVWAHNFAILHNGVELGRVEKQYFNWTDTYALHVARDEDAPFFTALVIAIDNCLHQEDS